jgi:hypothetical protein
MSSNIIKFILVFLMFVNIMIVCLFAIAGGNYFLIIIHVLINLYNILAILYILSDFKEE